MHYASRGVKFIAVTCIQKIQGRHRKGATKQTELCHVPQSSYLNFRSSRKKLESLHTKRKVNVLNGQVEKSDWSKRDFSKMLSKIRAWIRETGVNVESNIYGQLKSTI